jgi:hypothetical protein
VQAVRDVAAGSVGYHVAVFLAVTRHNHAHLTGGWFGVRSGLSSVVIKRRRIFAAG